MGSPRLSRPPHNLLRDEMLLDFEEKDGGSPKAEAKCLLQAAPEAGAETHLSVLAHVHP